jgi:HEAT repeat protein
MRFLILALGILTAAVTHAAEVPVDLVLGLKAADAGERIKAIKALSKLGTEAVPHLIDAMKDPEGEVSKAGVIGLRALKVDADDFVKAVKPFVNDKAMKVRVGVAAAILRGGANAVPILDELLRDESIEVRMQALQSAQGLASKYPTAVTALLPALTRVLKVDDSTAVRYAALQPLSKCGLAAAAALLEAAGTDKDAKVRTYAIAALHGLKVDPKEAVPVLVKRLQEDPDTTVRRSAVRTLAKLGPDAVAPLQTALADKINEIQLDAVTALGQLGDDAKSALPSIKDLAQKADHPSVRKAAVMALGKLGPDGETAVAGLIKGGDSATRLACLQALAPAMGQAPDKKLVPDLIIALGDEDLKVKAVAATLLGQIGPEAKSAVPALKKAAAGAEPAVRELIEKCLGKIENP